MVYIGLNTNANSPIGIITGAGQVVAYIPGDGKRVYGSITLAGHALMGHGCWMDYARYRG
jgi:hypothetical protein